MSLESRQKFWSVFWRSLRIIWSPGARSRSALACLHPHSYTFAHTQARKYTLASTTVWCHLSSVLWVYFHSGVRGFTHFKCSSEEPSKTKSVFLLFHSKKVVAVVCQQLLLNHNDHPLSPTRLLFFRESGQSLLSPSPSQVSSQLKPVQVKSKVSKQVLRQVSSQFRQVLVETSSRQVLSKQVSSHKSSLAKWQSISSL